MACHINPIASQMRAWSGCHFQVIALKSGCTITLDTDPNIASKIKEVVPRCCDTPPGVSCLTCVLQPIQRGPPKDIRVHVSVKGLSLPHTDPMSL